MRRDDSDAYVTYIADTGMAEYRATPGNQGAWMFRRDDDDRSEIITLSFWDSRDTFEHSPARTLRKQSSTLRMIVSWSNVISWSDTTTS